MTTASEAHGRIYVVTNVANGKQYVGQTTLTVDARWHRHVSDAIGHRNHCRALAQAIRKYGSSNFVAAEIDTGSDKEDLDIKELRWVATLGSMAPHGYNLTEGGGSAGRPSKETIEKRRTAMLGHPTPRATRDKIRKALVGRVFTPEHREKLRQAKLGRKPDAEMVTRRNDAIRRTYAEKRTEIVAKITSVHLGTHHSEATKEKMRLSARNRKKAA